MMTPQVQNPAPIARALPWLLKLAALAWLGWSLSRLGLLMWRHERWSVTDLPLLLGTGARVDSISVGILLSLPIVLWPLLARARSAPLWWYASRLWIGVIFVLAMVLEVATPTFMAQYEARPNHLAVEYLKELPVTLPMLWNGFRAPLLLGVAVLTIGLASGIVWVARRAPGTRNQWAVLALWPLLVLINVYVIRNSFDHRPANPAMFARWSDQLLNNLALNSSYSFGYAVYAQRHERSAMQVYQIRSDEALRSQWHEDVRFARAPAATPTLRWQSAAAVRAAPVNLIIVVEESLGADFSARLGGRGLTPQLDRWADQGLWFEQLYATGTRSARGLEAIVAGFPPSPAPAVLKRDGAQENFATLASVLRAQGYKSRFIYGGAAHFDNMRGFFLGNGFDAVIEQRDFADPRHVSSWGVSDEDLFARALDEADAAYLRGERSFHLVFSSSHHEPFDIPAGRLPPEFDHPGSADAAVRYADMAVGQFLDAAAQKPWFANTLILVVADHDVRVYGDDVVPLRRFQIPGLIVGAGTGARAIQSLASQIDLAPTLLSMMGISAEIPFPGRDLTTSLAELGGSQPQAPRALMQFEDRFAWLTQGQLDVLLPGADAQRWQVQQQRLSNPQPLQGEAREDLLAQALLGDWLYQNRAYQLAPKAVAVSQAKVLQ
ncbi:LTA synthase family protein [Sinimarinibacterium sp. NLF-5-8]|uniref:LTA synthase family protein n=1 Tax=Sinimarinibacterium sp. NLF-5-8 TaxID=2698684 RepID=UPI00137C13DF|nr:LTA synthase family protein [Sinimarinibacterium sp. NLF-5-8]QHS09786.1 sulfatase-like hydrolase/transferase [Sinimarinibacterium sp. NLF-5-8]